MTWTLDAAGQLVPATANQAATVTVRLGATPATVDALQLATPVTISQLPAVVNVEMVAGDDLALLVTVADEDGAPVDLTGATLLAQLRATPAATLAGTWTTQIVQPDTVHAWLKADVTAALPARVVYDLRMRQDGWTSTLIAGTVTLTPAVTQWPG